MKKNYFIYIISFTISYLLAQVIRADGRFGRFRRFGKFYDEEWTWMMILFFVISFLILLISWDIKRKDIEMVESGECSQSKEPKFKKYIYTYIPYALSFFMAYLIISPEESLRGGEQLIIVVVISHIILLPFLYHKWIIKELFDFYYKTKEIQLEAKKKSKNSKKE